MMLHHIEGFGWPYVPGTPRELVRYSVRSKPHQLDERYQLVIKPHAPTVMESANTVVAGFYGLLKGAVEWFPTAACVLPAHVDTPEVLDFFDIEMRYVGTVTRCSKPGVYGWEIPAYTPPEATG